MKMNVGEISKWYANTGGNQAIVYEEVTGKNIAVSYDVKDANLIASAPELLELVKELAQDSYTNFVNEDEHWEHIAYLRNKAQTIIGNIK